MKKLNELTMAEFWDWINSLCDYEVPREKPEHFEQAIFEDSKYKLCIDVLEDDREDEYWYYTVKISRFDSPTDSVIIRWTGDYDSWNGVEWNQEPEMVIEKSETRVVTWYESVNNG